jgi:D-3-phosphoglycerate dehydrogenase
VANAAYNLGMEIIFYDNNLSLDNARALPANAKQAKDSASIVAECDYITLHVPFTEQTVAEHKFTADRFAMAKDGLVLINFSRGELVDDEAVKQAVADKKVACYVTDFPNENLLGVDNIITIPHLGASTAEAEENCAVMASQQIKNFLLTGNIVNSVNYPQCEMAWTNRTRICITHENVPNVIGPFTSAIANAKINIDNMINKSRADFAYTMIDVDGDVTAELERDLMNVHGVISVRII